MKAPNMMRGKKKREMTIQLGISHDLCSTHPTFNINRTLFPVVTSTGAVTTGAFKATGTPRVELIFSSL